jgi:nucleoside-diphosphate-sugar epimerase
LRDLGAKAVMMDGLDAMSVGEAVAAARPEAIVHQMTALSIAKYGRPSFRHPERFAATTNRLRTEGTDNLLAAAEATGVSHVVAQSVAIWYGGGNGGRVTEEETASPEDVGPKVRPGVEAGRHVEDMIVKAGGAALRYGGFYGPGATDDQIELVRKRWFPLIGDGAGYFSWVHLDDAASATVLAIEQKANGVFNVVDDEPAPVRDWLPYLAELVGAKKPRRVPGWLARMLLGDMIIVMTQRRGFSNAKAKRELGWAMRYPSWRQGFKEALA